MALKPPLSFRMPKAMRRGSEKYYPQNVNDGITGFPDSVRQVYMKEDGTLTDIPARDTERPQLEKQGNLLLWAVDQEKQREGEK